MQRRTVLAVAIRENTVGTLGCAKIHPWIANHVYGPDALDVNRLMPCILDFDLYVSERPVVVQLQRVFQIRLTHETAERHFDLTSFTERALKGGSRDLVLRKIS